MIISRSPFRLSFLGGSTDFPWWFKRYGGAVLGTSIDKYCYLTCRYLPPFFEHRLRVVYSHIELCQHADQIKHPAVRAVLKFMDMNQGVEIHHDGDLPARSGIGSSSSFTVGLLNGLYALQGRAVDKMTLAKEAIYIEQEILKETVGCQDQVLAALGGFNHIEFRTNGEFHINPITISQDTLKNLNDHMMLFYTGIQRNSSAIAATYQNEEDDRLNSFHEIKGLVSHGLSILTAGADPSEFGRLLNENWKLKRSLSDAVSMKKIDQIYDHAISAGAVGGKLSGAGGGGFLLLVAPPERQPEIRERLKKLLFVPFKFEWSGSQIIFLDREVEYPEQVAAQNKSST